MTSVLVIPPATVSARNDEDPGKEYTREAEVALTSPDNNGKLRYFDNVFNESVAHGVVKFAQEVIVTDSAYNKEKCLHGRMQAGEISYGEKFVYAKRHSFEARDIPDILLPIKQTVECVTRKEYNIILVKCYTSSGTSLAAHRDMDGSPMSVACVTFFDNPAARRNLLWYMVGKNGATRYDRVVKTLSPASGSIWTMEGNLNSVYSHRVDSAHGSDCPTAIRVSLTFRRVEWKSLDRATPGSTMTCL